MSMLMPRKMNGIVTDSKIDFAEIRGNKEATSIIFTCINKAEVHINTAMGISDIKSILINAKIEFIEVE